MNKKHDLLIAVLCLFLVSGCGLFGNDSPSREQIEADIKRQPLKVKVANGTVEWDFNPRSYKPLSCFSINTGESKITATNADLSVTVASWSAVQITNKSFYSTLYGKMLMRYKKEGDKWILENAEPLNLTFEKPTNLEDFEKFVQRAMPICAGKSGG